MPGSATPADELNAPAYLQRYLLEAQQHFLQQQQQQLQQHQQNRSLSNSLHHLPADVSSSALPILDTDDPIPPEVLAFLAAEDEPVPPENFLSGDSVSVVEELSSRHTKSTGWKKSFKSTGSGNSRNPSKANSRQSSRHSHNAGKHSSIEVLDADLDMGWVVGEGVGSVWGGSSSNRSNSIVDRNENLKKAGLSIIHIEGNSTDPGFEMIVPYVEDDEEESNYSSRRRRKRREEMAEQNGWTGDKPSLKERVIKAGLVTLVFGVIVGIFIGVVVHFSQENAGDDSGEIDEGYIGRGSFHGFKR